MARTRESALGRQKGQGGEDKGRKVGGGVGSAACHLQRLEGHVHLPGFRVRECACAPSGTCTDGAARPWMARARARAQAQTAR